MKNNKQFVDLDNARVAEQRKVMEQIIKAGHCPFCLENFIKYNNKPFLKEGKFWFLVKNKWPYKHTKVHLLAIYKKHAVNLQELDPEAGKELIELMQWIEKEYQVPGGGIAMRFGDTNYSAGTVNHLHVQFIQPDIHHPDYLERPVRVKIGKTK